MSRRVTKPPPELPSFTYIETIGAGGYADVYLYQQQMPHRRVAVKVLDLDAMPGGGDKSAFTHEANVMAMVSAHPYIVQVFHAAIAPDGRPYLVMEYYPHANFHARARSERFDVAEVLSVGVQLACAVETAHRASILHRDIKPANILTSTYRKPGLTDFGIAAAQGLGGGADALSVPWSPPEAFGGTGDRRSDVYSLAATLHTLLTGRSPFEIAGGDNGQLALLSRIERANVPSVGRSDVPASLERVLAGAMSKDPDHRPSSAVDFARQLQAVESEMRLAVTLLELEDDGRAVRLRVDDDDESTRIKGIQEVSAQPPPAGWSASPTPAISGVSAAPTGFRLPLPARDRVGMLDEPDVTATVMRGGQVAPELAPPESPRGVPKVVYAAIAAAAVVAAVVGGVVVLGGNDDAGKSQTQEESVADDVEVNDNIGAPVAVSPDEVEEVLGVANADGTYTFTWNAVAESVLYAVQPEGSSSSEDVDQPTFTGTARCISVSVVSANGSMSQEVKGCAP